MSSSPQTSFKSFPEIRVEGQGEASLSKPFLSQVDKPDSSEESTGKIAGDSAGHKMLLLSKAEVMASKIETEAYHANDHDQISRMNTTQPIVVETEKVVSKTDSTDLFLSDETGSPDSAQSHMDWPEDADDRAKETEDLMEDLNASKKSFRNSLSGNPPADTNDPVASEQIDMIDETRIDSDFEDAEAEKKFSDIERYYAQRLEKGRLDDVDEVEFERARQKEETRRRHRRMDNAHHDTSDLQDESIYISDEDLTSQKLGGEIEDEEFARFWKAKQEKSSGRGNDKSSRSQDKGATRSILNRAIAAKVTKPRKTPRRGTRSNNPDLVSSVLRNGNNLIALAQANQQKEAQPTFTSTTKDKALKEMISSMPEAQRKINNVDRKELELASKKFVGKGAVRADGQGGWRLKGMTASLKAYQLIGAAFMRDRENAGKPPYGGLIADEMGLGKTVLAIANIIDGQAANIKSKAKATLVVAPSALLSQWMSEINKHAEKDKIKDVILYRSEKSLAVRNCVEALSHYDVVITSYHQLLRSWPKNDPPPHLCTKQAKDEWYADQCKHNIGHLHQVTWQRIILDEAHAIKNHLSRTSEAACELKGKYRWAISGTPVQNKIEEFFAIFKFARLPHSCSYEAFKNNFCKRDSERSWQRLQFMLSRYMLRRTHADTMFGRPILILPNIKSTTVEVTFSHIEKAIYSIIKERFLDNVKKYVRSRSTEKNYQNIFVLLLRLRQIAAHCLLVQNTLKDLLEEADLERLWALTRDDSHPEDRHLIQGLKHSLRKTVLDGHETSHEAVSTHPIRSRFRKYLQSLKEDGKDAEIRARTICAACKSPPVDRQLTACHHIFCRSCLEDLKWEAQMDKEKKGPRCVACGIFFDRHVPCLQEDFLDLERDSPVPIRSGIRTGTSNPEETDTDWFTIGGPIVQSAKSKGAVVQIEKWLQEDEAKREERSKIIIFTQFKGMMKVMMRICQECQWAYVTFHGDMSFEARDKAVEQFSHNPDCFILIASLKAGGVGLNLTAGSRVIIIDLWWNQSVETQAFCRAYRIGQVRDVEVVRFVVRDTIDENIVAMQERKNAEIDKVIENTRMSDGLSVKEMLQLFTDLERDTDGRPSKSANEEPFIFMQDTYHQEHHAGDGFD